MSLLTVFSGLGLALPATSFADDDVKILGLTCPSDSDGIEQKGQSLRCGGSSAQTYPHLEEIVSGSNKLAAMTVAITPVTLTCKSPHTLQGIPQIGQYLNKAITCSSSAPDPKVTIGTTIDGDPTAAAPTGVDQQGNGIDADGNAISQVATTEDNSCTNASGSCATCTDPNDATKSVACSSVNDPALTCKSNDCDLVGKYINPTITLLNGTVGLVIVISFIMAGINYSMAGGDSQKVSKAKDRVVKTVIGLFTYLFLYGLLQFIVPGGIFNRS